MAETSSSSAIDLSRLPAPTIVDQPTYETIRAELVADMAVLAPDFDAAVESDPAVKLLELVAYRELLLRGQFDDRARQVMVAYATGANLDQLGALMGVPRLLVAAEDPDRGTPAIYESDDAFRRRIVLAPESFSVAGPATAYVFHALSADATITDASASSPAPGEVLVSLLGAAGDGTATPAQIAAVEARLGLVPGNRLRPLTDLVRVASAVIVPYVVDARLTLHIGPDPTVVLAQAQARLEEYLARTRRLGNDVTLSALYAALHVEGVHKVTLLSPLADVVIDDTRAAHCAGLNVAMAGYGS